MFWRQLKPLLAVKGFVFVLGLLSQLLISQLFPILTSHRILECYVQGRQPAAQAAQSHIQPGLECLQGWDNGIIYLKKKILFKLKNYL